MQAQHLKALGSLTCFKAYDFRSQLGADLNEAIAYRTGRAYAEFLNAKRVVIGGGMRLSTQCLKQTLASGLMHSGCDALDLGMTGTEEAYFATFYRDVDGGIEVTASHNPIDFNGIKPVRRGAEPISGEINYKVANTLAAIDAVKAHYTDVNPTLDTTDGLSMDFGNWRMNNRASNTEPLLRLNIEAKGNAQAVNQAMSTINELLK